MFHGNARLAVLRVLPFDNDASVEQEVELVGGDLLLLLQDAETQLWHRQRERQRHKMTEECTSVVVNIVHWFVLFAPAVCQEGISQPDRTRNACCSTQAAVPTLERLEREVFPSGNARLSPFHG